MPRFLVYVDANSIETIDAAFNLIDKGYVDEYITLTQDGKPIVYDETMVSNPVRCNAMANNCKNVTE